MHAPSDAEKPEISQSPANRPRDAEKRNVYKEEAIPGESVKVADLTRAFNTGSKPEVGFQGEYVFEDIPTQGGIRYTWAIRPKTAGLSVKGKLDGVLTLDCARCLMPFTAPVSLAVDERYVFSRFVEDTGREKELQAEDFYETADEEGFLDLKDLARQFLLLEMENHPLCGLADCHFTTPDNPDDNREAEDTPETYPPL
jgi:uncharacterized metal-binding protein YceD (DUF177 family)